MQFCYLVFARDTHGLKDGAVNVSRSNSVFIHSLECINIILPMKNNFFHEEM